jgi:hypothetical protein
MVEIQSVFTLLSNRKEYASLIWLQDTDITKQSMDLIKSRWPREVSLSCSSKYPDGRLEATSVL